MKELNPAQKEFINIKENGHIPPYSLVTGLLLNATQLTKRQWCSNPACGSMSLAIIPALFVFANGLINLFFRKRLLSDKEIENA